MTKTLMINLIFFIGLINYYYYINDFEKIATLVIKNTSFLCVSALLANSIFGGERLDALGINSNTIAMFAAYSMILVYNKIINRVGNKRKNIILLLLFIVTIVMSGSRKGLIIPLIGIYVLTCFRQPRKFVVRSLLVIIIALISYQLLIHIDALYSIIGYRVEQVILLLLGQDVTEASLVSRDSYILLAWNSSQNSIIWGHGLDTFRLLKGAFGTYSHSNILEIIYSLGVCGIVAYYFPHVILIFRAFKNLKEKKLILAPMIAIIVPFVICDYMNVTYFARPILSIAILALVSIENECKKV